MSKITIQERALQQFSNKLSKGLQPWARGKMVEAFNAGFKAAAEFFLEMRKQEIEAMQAAEAQKQDSIAPNVQLPEGSEVK